MEEEKIGRHDAVQEQEGTCKLQQNAQLCRSCRMSSHGRGSDLRCGGKIRSRRNNPYQGETK